MKWQLLKENKCPQCGRALSPFGGFRKCAGQLGEYQNRPVCEFIIRESRFNDLVKSMGVDYKLNEMIEEHKTAEDNYWNNPDF